MVSKLDIKWMILELLKSKPKPKSSNSNTISSPSFVPSQKLLNYSQSKRLTSWIIKRSKGYPLAYLLGNIPFGNLPTNLLCKSPILIPRVETEQWVMEFTEKIKSSNKTKEVRCLDLCTGSGIDSNQDAVDLANRNKYHIFGKDVDNSIDFFNIDIFSESIKTIVSNPPYISANKMKILPRDVSNHEDHRALYGGSDDGLKFIKQILIISSDLLILDDTNLKENLTVEFEGNDQQPEVETLLNEFKNNGKIKSFKFYKDNFGHYRWFTCVY